MFKAIKNFFQDLQVKLWVAFHGTKTRLAEERGDTNFISIAIVLIVVIGLAMIFIAFGDDIMGIFENKTKELTDTLNGR